MTFLWPQMLLLLLLVPALVGGYVWLLRRKKKEALRYASLSLVKEAIGPGQTVRRHLPPLLLLLSLIAAVIAIARPTAVITLPSKQQTIIMAMDVSLSMGARDVDPKRITERKGRQSEAGKEAASTGRAGFVYVGRDHSLERWSPHDGTGPARRRTLGGGPRRPRFHRRFRHGGRRHDRLRRLVGVRAS